MTNPAMFGDIESRWRPLTPAEQTIAETRLEDAWRKLKRDVRKLNPDAPDLESRFAIEEDLEAEAVKVLADSVARLLRNADTARKGSVTLDDRSRSWEYDEDYSSSQLYFTDDELAGLAPVTGGRDRPRAFSVMPS